MPVEQVAKSNADKSSNNEEEAKARVRKASEPFARSIEQHGGVSEIPMLKVYASDDQVTDLMRLNDLVKQHGLHCERVGNTYSFEDFTAHGLSQALGYAEGFDRAKSRNSQT